jgi:hypothetical protein
MNTTAWDTSGVDHSAISLRRPFELVPLEYLPVVGVDVYGVSTPTYSFVVLERNFFEQYVDSGGVRVKFGFMTVCFKRTLRGL